MQPDDRQPTLSGLADLVIQRIAAVHADWHRLLGQEALDGMGTGPAPEAGGADGSEFMRAEGGIFGLELDDGLSHFIWKPVLPRGNWGEEAGHPLRLEASGLSVEGALGCAGLARTFTR
jgi:hypothetical protein